MQILLQNSVYTYSEWFLHAILQYTTTSCIWQPANRPYYQQIVKPGIALYDIY